MWKNPVRVVTVLFFATCVGFGTGNAGDYKIKKPVDQHGDPLPAGATARLGTVRLRQGHAVWQLAFSSDNKRLIAVGSQIRFWDVASGKELATADWVPKSRYLALSTDGKTLAEAVYSGKTLVVWNTANGEKIHHLKVDPKNYCWDIAMSPDNKFLTGGFSGNTLIWNLNTGKALLPIPGDARSIAPSPKGELVARHVGKIVEVWRTSTGNKISEFAEDNVWAITFCPNGKMLATGNYQKEVRLIEASTGKELHRLAGDGTTKVLAFSHDAKTIAAGSREGEVRLWNAETGKELHRFDDYQAEVYALAFSHDNKWLATGHADGTIRLWNLADGKPIHPTASHRGQVTALALTSDAKTLFSTGQDGLVGVWDLASATKRRDLASGRRFGGHLALGPDEFRLAVGGSESGRDSTLRLWDLRQDKELWSCPETVPWTHSFAFAPDGKFIAAGLSSDDIILRDALNGKPQATIPFESPVANSAASPSAKIVRISHDGKLLAVAGISGIRVWHLDSRKHLYFLSPDGKSEHRGVYGLAFSPDNRFLASAEAEGIHIWEIATGQRVATIPDAKRWVNCLCFSNDGRFLAKGIRNGDVVVMEFGNEKTAATFKGHRGPVTSLAFFPNNQRLASGSTDTTILIWNLSELRSRPAAKHELTAQDLEQAWRDLDSPDAAAAFKAGRRLERDPGQTLRFLEKRLSPVPRLEPGQIERLVGNLESAQFRVRDAAFQELEHIGEAALPGLRKALAAKPPLETNRRIEKLLAHIDVGFLPPAKVLRPLRALAVLERIGTPAAQKLLQSLGEGEPESRITLAARKSLERLKGAAGDQSAETDCDQD